MSRKIELNDVNELMNALGDHEKLYGYTPSEKYVATSFVYPIVAITNEEDKTYVIKQANEIKEEEKKEESKDEAPKSEEAPKLPAQSEPAKVDDKKAKNKKIAMIVGFTILGVAVVVGIILAIYFGVK